MTQRFVARDAENGVIVANRVNSVLELPAGTLLTTPVKVGDRIQIQ